MSAGGYDPVERGEPGDEPGGTPLEAVRRDLEMLRALEANAGWRAVFLPRLEERIREAERAALDLRTDDEETFAAKIRREALVALRDEVPELIAACRARLARESRTSIAP